MPDSRELSYFRRRSGKHRGHNMSEPISGSAAGVAGWKLSGGLAGASSIGAGLAALVVMCMNPPRTERGWWPAVISTVVLAPEIPESDWALAKVPDTASDFEFYRAALPEQALRVGYEVRLKAARYFEVGAMTIGIRSQLCANRSQLKCLTRRGCSILPPFNAIEPIFATRERVSRNLC